MKPKLMKCLAWVLAICFLNSGCIAFHPDKLRKKDGYYIKHFESCGPRAIRNALIQVDNRLYVRRPDYPSSESISKDIQATGNASRLVLSLAHHDALLITWPCEIKKYFTKKGYKVTETNLSSLSREDTAIILMKGNIFKQEWHWVTYPRYSKESIKSFYGSSTSIIKVFKISID
jgi:hypothetical protein